MFFFRRDECRFFAVHFDLRTVRNVQRQRFRGRRTDKIGRRVHYRKRDSVCYVCSDAFCGLRPVFAVFGDKPFCEKNGAVLRQLRVKASQFGKSIRLKGIVFISYSDIFGRNGKTEFFRVRLNRKPCLLHKFRFLNGFQNACVFFAVYKNGYFGLSASVFISNVAV